MVGTCIYGPSDASANGTAASNSESADAHMISVVPITEVFADGWKVSAVAVEYDKKINDASLSPSDYTVKTDVAGQNIINVYTSADGEKTSQRGQDGQYVILELSTDYVIPVSTGTSPKSANQGTVAGTPGQGSGGPSQGPGGSGAMQSTTAKENLILNYEVVTKVGNITWDPSAHPGTLKASGHSGDGKVVSVAQVGEITATDGMTITAGSSAKDNEYSRNLIVDGFMKPDYNDAGGSRVKYNIHFPRDYDKSKKYPVVLFFADENASVRFTHAEVLTQGLGGVIWADRDEEARNPCIVVVPAIRGSLENDESAQPAANGPRSTSYQTILNMMDYLLEQIPNIDKDRVYLTGQGGGARSVIRLMLERPDMFAAALLFAPDYDQIKITKLSTANMWIVVSEGDDAVYPNMEACIDSLKSAGAHISKAVWNGQSKEAQFVASVNSMIAEGGNIKYAVLKKGTVVPSGVSDDTVNNHAYTWRTGYSIKGLRNWLFTNKK